MSYNDEGQLTHIDAAGTGVFDAIYDTSSGTRILKRESGKTTLTVAGTDLTVDNTTGALTASRYYTWQGLTVGVRTGNTNDKLWSIVTDHQGTAHNQIRNSDSQLTTTWQDPYGNKRGTAPTTWAGQKGFVGGTNDATGLTRVGARDYDPALNRFTTVDPLQVTSDPLQGNGYAYADYKPVTVSDPSGLYIPGDEPGEFFFPTPKKNKHGKTKWYSTKPFQDRARHAKERARSTQAAHIHEQLDKLDRERSVVPPKSPANWVAGWNALVNVVNSGPAGWTQGIQQGIRRPVEWTEEINRIAATASRLNPMLLGLGYGLTAFDRWNRIDHKTADVGEKLMLVAGDTIVINIASSAGGMIGAANGAGAGLRYGKTVQAGAFMGILGAVTGAVLGDMYGSMVADEIDQAVLGR